MEPIAKPVKVLLFDLLPTVPYYSGHLAAALDRATNAHVILGAATYSHDKTFFRRMGLRNTSGALDIAYRVRTVFLRRISKIGEYLLNLVCFAANAAWRKPDVIHLQFTPLLEHKLPFELWFVKAARARGIKVIYTVHNILPHEGQDRLRSTYARLYREIDHFICHDLPTKRQLSSEFGIDPECVSVIPHGPLFQELPRSRVGSRTMVGLPHAATVFLWQGIMRRYKGVPFLLRAWKKARESGLEGVLAIVGTGAEDILGEVRELVRSLGIASSVHLNLSFVSVEQLAAYHEAADILVYPYSSVTTSGALMTGIGYGKAIIASNIPAFQQVLKHEKNALLVSPTEVNDWANALLRVAGDDELREKLAAGLASDGANGSSWDDIATDTLLVYRETIHAVSARSVKE
jgi:glycosyltransferase involved in cell wall biosynthesis